MGPGRICRHCEKRSDEAIHNYRIHASDCFAEPVIGRRGACHRMRMRATRWVAMTISGSIWLFSFPVMLQGRFAGANSDTRFRAPHGLNVVIPGHAPISASGNDNNPKQKRRDGMASVASQSLYSLVRR